MLIIFPLKRRKSKRSIKSEDSMETPKSPLKCATETTDTKLTPLTGGVISRRYISEI